MRHHLLSILVAVALMLGGMTSGLAQSAITTYDFTTPATLSFGSGGFGLWNTQADITISGTPFILTCGGNGSFTNAASGGASNSMCLRKDGSGGDQFILQRTDGQPFQFYGIWVTHQSMNQYIQFYTLPPWYTLTASTFSFQDMTPITAGTAWNDYTYSTLTISPPGTIGITTTSVQISFQAIIYFSVDDIIVGPAPPSLPTVTTTTISIFNTTSATLGGNITADGGATVTERGIVYSLTDATPTIDEGATKVTIGSGTGSFSQSVGSLTPGTLHYVKAYATNSVGTKYGSLKSFTTTAVTATPTITSISPANGLEAGGTLVTITGTNLTGTTSVMFGSNAATGVTVNSATSVAATSPTGTGTVHITVTTAGGTSATSSSDQFTYIVAPTVTTQAVSNIYSTTAVGNGNITALGSPNPTAYGVCWNTGGAPTTSDNKVDKGFTSASGAFTASITSLSPSTTYKLRAFATNTAGTSYGDEVSFTTTNTPAPPVFGSTRYGQSNGSGFNFVDRNGKLSDIPLLGNNGQDFSAVSTDPTLLTVTLESVVPAGSGAATAVSGIRVSTTPVLARGVCWNISTGSDPVIANLHTVNGSGDTNYTSSISDLPGTYKVRAWAINSSGLHYSIEVKTVTIP